MKNNKFSIFFAPGRVNLIGEHTDYNGGHVFPCAITRGTYLASRKRQDRKIKLYSINKHEQGVIETSLDELLHDQGAHINKETGKESTWADYPKGVIATFMQHNYSIDCGLDLIYYGDIPTGAGLSSSASIEVVTGVMLKTLYQLDISGKEIAVLCQIAENEYNGMKCGIMDQFASAMGKENHAIFLDTSDLSYEYVKLDMNGCKLVIANTNKPHKLTESKYNERRQECELALKDIQEAIISENKTNFNDKASLAGINSLCDLDIQTFEKYKESIKNEINRKRAKHAVYENVRVVEAVRELKNGNRKRFGELMREAHISMSEDYEATGAELDTLADAAWKTEGCIGSRMTGGGFGGCTVSIVKEENVQDFIDQVGKEYREKIGYDADFYVMTIGGAPREITFKELQPAEHDDLIQWAVTMLTGYGMVTGLITEEDMIYTINLILMTLEIDEYTGNEEDVRTARAVIDSLFKHNEVGDFLAVILKILTDYACNKGITDGDSIVYRDLFDTKLMGLLTPKPSEVICQFKNRYEDSQEHATEWYYDFSKNTNYIRRDRIANDMKWKTKTEYGEMDITINLSKPEKDPKAIAAAGKLKPSGYPRCQLCRENEGYAGRLNHPARQNHRIIPITIQGMPWGFQYSPYVYYNEHCIVFNFRHVPMKIDHNTFCKLFDFVKLFPHYFIGSNADLPIVGGSILSHDHFQGGRYTFAMEKAEIERQFVIEGFEDVKTGIVKWPMSVIRISSKASNRVIELADRILEVWRDYTDETAFIYAETDGVPHNTITPIARMRAGEYELDLVLRNNITTEKRPLGVFHPNESLHHIKKENIGLIEVMGLAVLPARLKSEMHELKKIILTAIKEEGSSELLLNNIVNIINDNERIRKHAEWTEKFLSKYDFAYLTNLTEAELDSIIKNEISHVFVNVLEDAGVFKRDENGRKAFERFISSI